MAAKERKSENYPGELVVEGYSDLLFYAEVLETVGKHEQVFIKELGGKSGLNRKLEAFVTPALLARKTAIAFVFDADESHDATRQSLENLLSNLTGQAVSEGKWTQGIPKIGLMIVPGAGAKGEIETLVWQSWSSNPDNAGQKKCIQDFVTCMHASNVKPQSPDKGLIGALLALKNDEDPRLGPGARAKVFDLNSPHLQPLRQFLTGF
ncbi:MAG: DUF3226 domain-containing protein [Verrucomicrobiota bacterium]|jgi:hypothetical protein